MLNTKFLKVLSFVAAVCSLSAHAGLIQNGDFSQNPTTPVIKFSDFNPHQNLDQYATATAKSRWAVLESIPGWTLAYGPGIEMQFDGVDHGHQIVNSLTPGGRFLEFDTHFATGQEAAGSHATIYQILNGLTIGQTYRLDFWYRARTKTEGDSGLGIYWTDASFAPGLKDLFFQKTYNYDASNENSDRWVNYTLDLKANSSNMLIGFAGFGGLDHFYQKDKDGKFILDDEGNKISAQSFTGNGKGALVSNIQMTAVSAPGSIALLSIGLLGLVQLRRHQTRA